METSLRAPLIVSCRKRRGLERLEAAVFQATWKQKHCKIRLVKMTILNGLK